jgi:hypothetical protein
MVKHLDLLRTRFGHLELDMPLFPTARGGVPSKAKVVESLEYVMKLMGLRLVGDAGNRLYGGHSCRVAGARYLASIGVDLLTIQLLGRWGSEVVLRYVADVPLGALTRRVLEKFDTLDLHKIAARIAHAPAVSSDGLGLAQSTAELLREEVSLLRQQVKLATHGAKYVINSVSRVVHSSLGRSGPALAWRTRCGWAFGCVGGAFESTSIPVGSKRCSVCFRVEAQDSSSSDAS